MDLTSKKLEALIEKEASLRAALKKVAEEITAEKKTLVEEKKAAGWKLYRFHSEYFGSHPEYGESDREGEFLFAPEVELPQFKPASHGHCDAGESHFEKWLEHVDQRLYLVIEEITEVR